MRTVIAAQATLAIPHLEAVDFLGTNPVDVDLAERQLPAGPHRAVLVRGVDVGRQPVPVALARSLTSAQDRNGEIGVTGPNSSSVMAGMLSVTSVSTVGAIQ